MLNITLFVTENRYDWLTVGVSKWVDGTLKYVSFRGSLSRYNKQIITDVSQGLCI